MASAPRSGPPRGRHVASVQRSRWPITFREPSTLTMQVRPRSVISRSRFCGENATVSDFCAITVTGPPNSHAHEGASRMCDPCLKAPLISPQPANFRENNWLAWIPTCTHWGHPLTIDTSAWPENVKFPRPFQQGAGSFQSGREMERIDDNQHALGHGFTCNHARPARVRHVEPRGIPLAWTLAVPFNTSG
jgi:hypothetical protein